MFRSCRAPPCVSALTTKSLPALLTAGLLVWLSAVESKAQGDGPDAEPLIIAQDHAWPPFAFTDSDGEPQGLLIDLWHELAAELGRPVEFQLVDWPDSIELVRSGSADLHGGLIASPERRRFLDFSEPMINLSTFLFVRSGAGILSLEDLRGQDIGVVAGSYELEYLRQERPLLSYRQYANNDILIRAAVSGTVDAFVADYPVAMYLLDQHAAPSDFHPLLLLYSHPLRAGVTADNAALLQSVNDALSELDPEVLRRITQRWMRSERQEVTPQWFYPLLIASLLALVLLYVLMLRGRSRRLRLEVETRTRELATSESLFRALADNSSAGIFMIRGEQFEIVNPAMSTITGYPREELLQMSFPRLIHPADRSMVRRRARMRQSGESVPHDYDFRFITREGDTRWIRLSVDAIPVEGELVSVGTCIDITEHKDAKRDLEAEGRFSRLVADTSAHFANASQSNIDARIDRMLHTFGQNLGADRAYLFRYSEDGQFLRNTHEWCAPGVASAMDSLQNLATSDIAWLDAKQRQMLQEQRPLIINDTRALPAEAATERDFLENDGVRALLLIPVQSSSAFSGFFGFDSLHPRTWPEQQAQQLMVVAHLLAEAMGAIAAEAFLTRESLTDPLTGLYNRRYLDLQLNHWMKNPAGQSRLSLAMIDIDRFKPFNDTHGHQAGDELLQQLGRLMQTACREQDVVIRFGGEEFILLLRDTPLTDAGRAISRLLDRIRQTDFRVQGQTHRISVSCGLASTDELAASDKAPEHLIGMADQRLYGAKRRGRDCLVDSTPEPSL